MSTCFFEELFDCLFGKEEKSIYYSKPLKPSPEPLPKLTVKIFRDPEYENYRYTAVDADGTAKAFVCKPVIIKSMSCWVGHSGNLDGANFIDGIYDASDWENSLIANPYIEIEKKEYNLKQLKDKLKAQATNPLLEIRKLEAEIRELKKKIGECE